MDGIMRIGELSRRTGVSPELLRAWERRYGLLQPIRSEGGFRLYSEDDEARIRRTTMLIADGLSAAEAARQTREGTLGSVENGHRAPAAVEELTTRLRAALDRFESQAAHVAIDGLLSVLSVESFVVDVAIPYLHDVGERWRAGSASVAQEHFASNLLRGRLLGLGREWGNGGVASAVLACLPGESHDLGLIMFGLLIARRGWRVTFLGPDTPLETLQIAVGALAPSLVVLSTVDARRMADAMEALRSLGGVFRVAVAGPIDEAAAEAAGIERLPDDILQAARALHIRATGPSGRAPLST